MSLDEVRIAVAMEAAGAIGMGAALQVEHLLWRGADVQYRKAAQTLIYKSRYEASSFGEYVAALLSGRDGGEDSAKGTGGGDASWRECDERLRALCSAGQLDLPEAGTQCSDCRSRDIKFTLLQTRSADEPMSVFCRCERCGKRWRM